MILLQKLLIDIFRLRLLILFIGAVIGIIWLFVWECIEIEVFIAFIGLTFTAYLGILKQTIEDDRVFKELFTSLNARYSNQINDLMNELQLNNRKELEPNEELQIIDYFNLCSEEFLWYSKGRIPLKVWKAWEAGIIVNLSIQQVYNLFQRETSDKNKVASYYGFVEYIRPKIKSAK